MSLSLLFFIFLGYFLYRFIAGFVLPVARTAKGMKKQFDQMKQHAGYAPDEQATASNHKPSDSFTGNSSNHQQNRTTSGRKGAKEDYIDFEELPASKF